ncbi:MAG: hypothetical protein EON47_16160 [Acetobacteraceae bacterium]|nr:MAG: hypothetical protein EON47_16160 [Acetobacteraceae bacterium]
MSAALKRARALLSRRGAWIDAVEGGYGLRLGPDRRCRVDLRLTEADFLALVEAPGLAGRPGGGWRARPARPISDSPAPGRPGVIDGVRAVMLADGKASLRTANLGESPVAWLARRRDRQGRPWLTPAQIAAGERLRADVEIAMSGPSLTMRWDALPRSGGGSSARVEPGDRALAAGRRVRAALSACAPHARAMINRICVRGSSLMLAEADLGLRRSRGRVLLVEGLDSLARHYGLT